MLRCVFASPPKDIYSTCRPGNEMVIATRGRDRAERKIGRDRSFVPERFHKKLFDRRETVTVTVLVEPRGNAFTIVGVEDI